MAKQSVTPSRRTMLAGLAAAPVAGLPAIAGAVIGDDPVFAALAERDHAHAIWEAAIPKTDAASEAIGAVIYNGEEVYTLPHLNHLAGLPHYPMTGAELEEAVAQLRRGWAMQQEELASTSPEYQAARATLEARQAARATLEARQAALAVAPESSAEEASDDAFGVFGDAERAVFEAVPTTQAGAVALLRFTAEFLEELGINDTRVEDVLPDAIRNAAAVLEREAQS